MQEMLYPTSYIKSRHLGKECALITDGRFSGGTSGLSYRAYLSRGRFRWRYRTGERRGYHRDQYPERSINVRLSDEELAERRKAEEARGKKPLRRRASA